MSEARLFVYGSLLFPEILEVVAGERLELAEAELEHFARLKLRDRVYPAIVPRPGSRVAGRVVDGVTPAGLARIDAFESDFYARLPVELRSGSRCLRAEAYVLRPDQLDLALEAEWDPEAFLRDHGARYLERCRAWARDGAW